MDLGERIKPEPTANSKSVSIETLGIILGSAILGATVAVSIFRAMQGGVETISMTGLLSFLFTLGLIVSAIVLSIIAISFSRTAERAVARKSEEIGAMQTTMVTQTVTAINQMEASVKRIGKEIADTVCDNFETLAEGLQSKLPSRDDLRADITEAIERSLAEARIVLEQPKETMVATEKIDIVDVPPVAEKISSVTVLQKAEPVTDESREKADKKYSEFKDIVLLGVANYPGAVARKIGEGQYRTEGDDLVDGVYIINNEKVAVCTFCTNSVITDRFMGETGDSFNIFLRSLFNELKRGHFSRIFLVFDEKLTQTSPYALALNGLSGKIDSDSFARFELFEGSPSVIIPELTERVSQLMDMVREKSAEEEEVPELSFRRQMMGA